MTSRPHRRAPLRRSSAPERILSAGLATATCVGIVGLVGARTIEANTASAESQQASADAVVQPVAVIEPVALEPTTASGLTEADLDTYAAQLAAEKDRLDAYRAKLVKTAKKLQRLAAQRNQQAAAPAAASSSSSAASQSSKPASKPAAKPAKKPAAKPASQPVAKPVAKPQAQPAPAPAPAPQQKPQSNTKTS